MRVDLGMDVFASDGAKIGSVEKIVLEPRSSSVRMFIVHRGSHDQGNDKLVDVALLANTDGDALHLNISGFEFDALPEFVENEFIADPLDMMPDTSANTPDGDEASAYLLATDNLTGDTYENIVDDTFFAPVTPIAPVVETRSNLAETDIIIDQGTDVFGADDEKIGVVREVVFGNDGQLLGFVVEKGWLFKHDMRVPIELVASADGTQIRLTVPGAEAETRAYNVEDTTL